MYNINISNSLKNINTQNAENKWTQQYKTTTAANGDKD